MEEGIWRLLHAIYADGGFFGLLVLGVLTLIFVAGYEVIRALVARFFNGVGSPMFRKMRRGNFKNHAIFNKYSILIKYRVPQLHIQCPLRKRIFIKLLEIRLTSARDLIQNFVEFELPRCGNEGLRDALSAMFMAISIEWQTRATTAGIPPIATERFKAKNEVYADLVDKTVLDICGLTTSYTDLNDKVDTILDIIGSMENSCLIAMEQTLDEINGDLSKATFEGVKCTQCRPECPNIIKT